MVWSKKFSIKYLFNFAFACKISSKSSGFIWPLQGLIGKHADYWFSYVFNIEFHLVTKIWVWIF